ncbi:MAG: hypothetical protein P1U84_12045 [Parvibaculaceae bacterium]|nr:hypothetical protein [Parvibaculaceae bacterium]
MAGLNTHGVRPFMRPVAEPGPHCVAELVVMDGNDAPRIYPLTVGQARSMLRRLSEGLSDIAEGNL